MSFFNLMSYQLSYLEFVLLIRRKAIKSGFAYEIPFFNVKSIYLRQSLSSQKDNIIIADYLGGIITFFFFLLDSTSGKPVFPGNIFLDELVTVVFLHS